MCSTLIYRWGRSLCTSQEVHEWNMAAITNCRIGVFLKPITLLYFRWIVSVVTNYLWCWVCNLQIKTSWFDIVFPLNYEACQNLMQRIWSIESYVFYNQPKCSQLTTISPLVSILKWWASVILQVRIKKEKNYTMVPDNKKLKVWIRPLTHLFVYNLRFTLSIVRRSGVICYRIWYARS